MFNIDYFYSGMFTEPTFYMSTIIFAIIAYLIGSMNAGKILSIIGSKDLGTEGSRNYGATNAGRSYGIKGFVGVFLFDLFKSLFVVIILEIIMTRGTFTMENISSDYFFYYASIPLALVWIVIGHSFPLYFSFQGGKGVATSFGCVIALNWVFAIIAITIFIAILLVTRWVALGSIFSTLIGGLLVIFAHPFFFEATPQLFFYWTNSWLSIFSAVFLIVFITYRHRKNIIVIINGQEPFFKPKGYVPKNAKSMK